MTRLGPLLAAALAAVAVLSACDTGDDPGPNFSSVSATPSASTSVSPTTSPSPTVPTTGPNVSPGEVAPTEAPDARENSGVGAQSFAAYYFKMLDWSYAVNRSDLMQPLFASTCDNCGKLTDNLAATFKLGTVTGTRVNIKQIALVDNDGRLGAQYAVSGLVQISGGTLMSANSSAPIPAEPDATITVWLSFLDDGFAVVSQAKV